MDFPEQLCLVNPIANNGFAMKRLGELREWGALRVDVSALITHVVEGS